MNTLLTTASTQPTLLSRRRLLGQLGSGALAATLPAWSLAADDDSTYDQESTPKAAADFFGQTTEGLAKVVERRSASRAGRTATSAATRSPAR